MSETKVMLTCRVPAEYLERADQLAGRMGLERSEVVRRSLRNGLESLEVAANLGTNPFGRLLVRLGAAMDGTKEERQELEELLLALQESRRLAKNPQLPGLD